ncbi:MAG: hypothetical protein AB7D46_02035 [Flavobacteriaceae bacterium]|nr:hypothetical protein [Flavobacterium sp.]
MEKFFLNDTIWLFEVLDLLEKKDEECTSQGFNSERKQTEKQKTKKLLSEME